MKATTGKASEGGGRSQNGLPHDNGPDFKRFTAIYSELLRLVALILLAWLPLGGWAAKEQNVVFLFDCTTSMKGYNGAPDIWKKAKDNLHSLLDKRPEGTRVTVIPFQDKALPAFTFESPDYKWEDL
ncbi:MAG: VWA domain-containing protein [Bacteroidales bacterium]|nr:VWA domain-containing protein [Bacteroidales bacterium]